MSIENKLMENLKTKTQGTTPIDQHASNTNLKTSFLNNAAQAKKAQKMVRVGRKDENSRNMVIVTSSSKGY